MIQEATTWIFIAILVLVTVGTVVPRRRIVLERLWIYRRNGMVEVHLNFRNRKRRRFSIGSVAIAWKNLRKTKELNSDFYCMDLDDSKREIGPKERIEMVGRIDEGFIRKEGVCEMNSNLRILFRFEDEVRYRGEVSKVVEVKKVPREILRFQL